MPKETTIIAEDNNSIPVENNIEPVSKNIEPQQEDNSKKQVQPQPNEINYEEIIKIIMEKGEYSINANILDFVFEDYILTIFTFSNQIILDKTNGTIIEEWKCSILEDGMVNYTKIENFVETETSLFNVSTMNEYEKEKYEEMNNYLRLVYDY